jgi:hypothetical protein
MLAWTNPNGVDTREGVGFLYFARIIDPNTAREHRYIGKSVKGESRLRAYRRNIVRIFAGLPRRITEGQQRYRAVHLAMAKACQHDWEYDFYPLENADPLTLNELENLRIIQLGCDLNRAESWTVDAYEEISIADLCTRSL